MSCLICQCFLFPSNVFLKYVQMYILSIMSLKIFTSSKSTFDISFRSTKLILIGVVFLFLLSSGTHDFLFLSPVSKHRLRRLKETATSVSLPLSLPASYSSLNFFHTGTLIEKREFLFFCDIKIC